MRMILFSILVIGLGWSNSGTADSFTIDQNGKTYLCDEISGGGSCWGECPYTFSSCVGSCGGGNECWGQCPYTFSSCVGSCGGGSSCWDQCPYTFSSCASSCGEQLANAQTILKFTLSHDERKLAEERDNALRTEANPSN